MPAKALSVVLVFCFLCLYCLPVSSHGAVQRAINPLLGDISYYERFGRQPKPGDDETLRIRTHLAYVEHLLRTHIPANISANLLPRRRQMLDLLHSYHQRGVFPSQRAFAGRRPHFIDQQGRLCAVGYLVASTAGRDLAERINREYSYAYLAEMKTPELLAWAKHSGLSLQELAMIQPTYGGDGGGIHITPPPPVINQALPAELVSPSWIPLMLLIGAEVLLTAGNIWLTQVADDETFASVKDADFAATAVLSTTLLAVGLGTALAPVPLSSQDRITAFLLGLSGIPVLGALNFTLLEQRSQQDAAATLKTGMFATPDRQGAWGLQATVRF